MGPFDIWKRAAEALDVNKFRERHGKLGVEVLTLLGLEVFLCIVSNPPFGTDELVACRR